jgi:hypothetical protein
MADEFVWDTQQMIWRTDFSANTSTAACFLETQARATFLQNLQSLVLF